MLVARINTVGGLFELVNSAGNGFTWDACEAMLEYYDMLEEDVNFDSIAIACNWNEVSLKQVETETGMDIDELRNHTTVYELENGNVLYMSF